MQRVLVVDDEWGILSSAKRVLSRRYEVVPASDGNEALLLIQSEAFDVALVDYRLGAGPRGDVVLAALRDRDPGCARVLMTGSDEADLWKTAVNGLGISHALSKPFDDRGLLGAVEHALHVTHDLRTSLRHEGGLATTRRYWRSCVDEGLLSLAVQPIVGAHSPHAPMAVECLIRSAHPALSRPDLLIAGVESVDAVFEFGWVVNRLASEWAARISPDTLIFVNVHPGQFADPDFFASFAPLMPHAHRVVLEITERADLKANAGWKERMTQLTDVGFRVALDDLGAGYNSLAMLAQLRPAFVKIDMSIIRGIHLEPMNLSLVELLAKFTEANGQHLVGEGVETEEEAEALRRCGVPLLQGYLFGRPGAIWPTPVW